MKSVKVLSRNKHYAILVGRFCTLSNSSLLPDDISKTNSSNSYNYLPKTPLLKHKKSQTSGEPLNFVGFRHVACKGGNGGNGAISFLREFNMEFGGPDGGLFNI